MDLRFVVIWIELGIIAMIGCVIAVALFRVITILKKNENIFINAQKKIIQHDEHIPTKDNIRSMIRSVMNAPVANVSVGNAPVINTPIAMNASEAITTIGHSSAGEVGVVFCRNCGGSYLSTEEACPECKTRRF